jgi:hypothetical protein
MRSIPKTPLSQGLCVVCIAACFVMIFASAIVGLGLMIAAVVLYSVGWVAGMR